MSYARETSGRLTAEIADGSLTLVQDVFRRFRSPILKRAGNSRYTAKFDGSPVTETDTEIELALQAELAQQFPEVPVFGEETGYGADLPPACWLVDPIDGTESFIKGTPTFTSMAVLIQAGEATAAVIYNPSTDDMYVARAGHGAYKNDIRLDLRQQKLPAKALCKGRHIEALNHLLLSTGVVCEIAPTGGGYGFTMVADGQAAARFQLHSRGQTHDYAPGALLVREAGGAVIPIEDKTYAYDSRSFVACHPGLETIVCTHLEELRRLELPPVTTA